MVSIGMVNHCLKTLSESSFLFVASGSILGVRFNEKYP